MATTMRLLKAQYIHYPEFYKEYPIAQLENFLNYHTKRMTKSQSFRLDCLMKDLDEHGLHVPIIVSENGYRVTVGHQRVWYAKQRGYTHISCYHIPNQSVQDRIMKTDYGEQYWRKHIEKHLECNSKNRALLESRGHKVEKIFLKKIECIDTNTPAEDKKAMDAALVRSIPDEGMLWPILIRKKTDHMWQCVSHRMVKNDAPYVCWYGNNRYRYAVRKEYDTIDAILCEGSNDERNALCKLMDIPVRVHNEIENIWLERGRKIVGATTRT